MNARQRFINTLTGKETDRVPFIKLFGGTNAIVPGWEKEYPGISHRIDEILKFEGVYRGWQKTPVNTKLSSLPEMKIIEENDKKILQKLGDGSIRVVQKESDFSSYLIKWPVSDWDSWSELKTRFMDPDDPKRFPKNWDEYIMEYNNRDYPLQLTHGGVYGFARNIMGDEALSYAFYDEPDLVHDIMDSYTDMCIDIWKKMVVDIQFDLIECWEDMAFNSGSFISPEIFREFMKPVYRKLSDFAKENDIEIILVDSDGFIEELSGLMIESGVNVMYPFEAQAGNDVGKILDRYPQIGCIGGLDKNSMARGKKEIDDEMEKTRYLIKKGRFIPGPDHFVLSDVSFENYKYFMDSLRKVVMETNPGI